MRPISWYLDYYLVPRLPRSHMRAWLEGAIFNIKNRDHPVYRDFNIRYRPGRYIVRFDGMDTIFNSGLENKLGLVEVTGYLMRGGLKRGDVVVDAGAYEGIFALLAARLVGPEGKVIAFEPDSQNCRRLEENIRLNGLQNITVVRKGVWSSDGTLRFCESGGDFSCISSEDLDTPVNQDWDSNAVIGVVSLDAELERLGVHHIDFLKADVEGSEFEMLKGAWRTLGRCDARLAIASYHIVDGRKTCYRVEDMLREHGYEAETNFPRHPTTYGWKDQSRL